MNNLNCNLALYQNVSNCTKLSSEWESQENSGRENSLYRCITKFVNYETRFPNSTNSKKLFRVESGISKTEMLMKPKTFRPKRNRMSYGIFIGKKFKEILQIPSKKFGVKEPLCYRNRPDNSSLRITEELLDGLVARRVIEDYRFVSQFAMI